MDIKLTSSRWRGFAAILLVSFLLFGYSIPAVKAEGKASIKTMTQNMDAGTDLKLVFYFLPDITRGATLTYAELLENDIPGRAAKLADEIAAKKPDIISLQEVTLWRTAPSFGEEATDVLYDQLDLLLDALAARKTPYEVVKTQELSDFTAPLDPGLIGFPPGSGPGALRFTDRDAVLVRSDIRKSHINVAGSQSGTYGAMLPIPPLGVAVLRGWISVDLEIGNTPVRFFNTHLESTYPDSPDLDFFARLVQAAQAEELAYMLTADVTPVILAGDLNSNLVSNGIENTDVPAILSRVGLTEVWGALHPDEPGFTWPLYLEDFQAPNPYGPYERIDLIYESGLEMLNIERVIRQSLPFASDHAGVVTTMRVR